MANLQYVRPFLYPEQKEALFHDKRYGACEASTKSGKTVGCIIWITEQALAGSPGQNFWWVAPSYNQARIAFGRLCQYITQGTFAANKSDLTISFINGTTVWFKTSAEPDKLYGEDVWAVVVDEASRVSHDAWIAVRSTLTHTKGKVRLIGNVKGRKNWFYHICRDIEKAEASDSGCSWGHYAKITSKEAVAAGVIDLLEVEDARRSMPDNAFKELYLAEPADDGGNPFGGDDPIDNCIAPLRDTVPICFGVDLAKHVDWTVVTGLDADGFVCRSARFQWPWKETIERIVEIVGNIPTLVDATGVGDPIVELLQRDIESKANIQGLVFTQKSKQQLIEGLAAAVSREEIHFPEKPYGIEMRSFEYVYKSSGVSYNAPDGSTDDAVCSLALAYKHYHKPLIPLWAKAAKEWVAPLNFSIFGR